MKYSKIELEKTSKILLLILPIFVIIYTLVQIIFSSGKLSPDSLEYLRQAENFYSYKTNFPLGYSFLIHAFSKFTGNIFWSSKIINLICYVFIIWFSWKKNFYFAETVLVFSFYPLIQFYGYTWSEPLFFLLFYLLIFKTQEILQSKIQTSDIGTFFILFFCLTAVRFSSIFVTIPTAIFILIFLRDKLFTKMIFAMITIIGVCSYLLINYHYSGFLMGKREHLLILDKEELWSFSLKTITSFLRDFSILNAFDHKTIKTASSGLNLCVSLLSSLAFIILLVKNKFYRNKWLLYLMFLMVTSFIGICISYYQIRIDDSIRIKSTVFFIGFFIFVILAGQKFINAGLIVAVVILVMNIVTYMIYSDASFIKSEPVTSQTPQHTSLQNPPPSDQFRFSHRNPERQNCH